MFAETVNLTFVYINSLLTVHVEISMKTFTRGSPGRFPDHDFSVGQYLLRSALFTDAADPATRFACSNAFSHDWGSRPLAEAVTASAGINIPAPVYFRTVGSDALL